MTLLILGLILWSLAHFYKRLMPAHREKLGEKGKGPAGIALDDLRLPLGGVHSSLVAACILHTYQQPSDAGRAVRLRDERNDRSLTRQDASPATDSRENMGGRAFVGEWRSRVDHSVRWHAGLGGSVCHLDQPQPRVGAPRAG